MNILVVDDARVMRRIVVNSIEENFKGDYEIFEAEDGIEALKALGSSNINLICLDWNMPKLNGLDFVKRIRKMENYSSIPVIMITSEAARYMIMDAVKAGVNDYVVKPVVGHKLWEKLAPFC